MAKATAYSRQKASAWKPYRTCNYTLTGYRSVQLL